MTRNNQFDTKILLAPMDARGDPETTEPERFYCNHFYTCSEEKCFRLGCRQALKRTGIRKYINQAKDLKTKESMP